MTELDAIKSAQKTAVEVLTEAIRLSDLSLRQLSRKLELKSHSSLSAIFSGKRALSLGFALRVCRVLNLNAATTKRVAALLVATSDSEPLNERKWARRAVTLSSTFDAAGLTGGQFHSKLPWVSETLRISNGVTAHQLHACFKSICRINISEIELCLQQLERMGLAMFESPTWRALDPSTAIISSSKTRQTYQTRIAKELLHSVLPALERGSEKVFLRTTFNSMCAAQDADFGGQFTAITQKLVDDLREAETPEDNRVIGVLVVAVELASADEDAPT